MKISVITCSIRPEGLAITQKCLKEQTFTDFEWIVELGLGVKHDLNAAYNRALRRASGELVVSLQDYIKVPPDYLQKFWTAHSTSPKTLFTAPVGKVDNLDYKTPAKWDWRAYKVIDKMRTETWEIDSACAPLQMFKDVGGFDEVLDQWWSFDNVSVALRAEKMGYSFANLFENPSLAYDHDAFSPHPFRDDFRPAKVRLRFEDYETTPKLDYL